MAKTESNATDTEREAKAEKVVKYYVAGAVALSSIPVPFIDLLLVSSLQLQMIRSLAKVYDVPFSKQLGKSLIASLAGASLPELGGSAMKVIPGVGQCAGIVVSSVIGGASTYAVGMVFIQHFESGGTFLTFESKKVREYYAQQLERGKSADTVDYADLKP